jgi:hypothetical protein
MDYTGALKGANSHGVERKYGSTHKMTCKRNKLGREGNMQNIEFDLYINGGIDWWTPLVRKLVKEEYTDIIGGDGANLSWKLPNCTFVDTDGETRSIPTDEKMTAREMAVMIAKSDAAKEHIRTAFEIPALPSQEEVAEVEKERLTKRTKKKKLDDEPLSRNEE